MKKPQLRKEIKFLSERIEQLQWEKTVLIEQPNGVVAAEIRHTYHYLKVIEESILGVVA